MGEPEPRPGGRRRAGTTTGRYGRWAGALALLLLALITLNTLTTRPNGSAGLTPGEQLPPFAVPLVSSDLQGAADVATRPHEGLAGEVPACRERGPRILNVCQLYEQGPLVLALFVDGGSCPDVLSEMQRLVVAYPQVRFAAVSIRGGRQELRRLVRSRRITFPVGIDEEGELAALYKLASCPQVTLAARGGHAAGRPLLATPSPSQLRARVAALAAAQSRP